MTTTKQSWLKRSLAVLLAVMMVMSMGVADVFAVEPSGTMLTDGTYKVPLSFNYYMAGQMYEMAAGKPNALRCERWNRLCNKVPVSLAGR